MNRRDYLKHLGALGLLPLLSSWTWMNADIIKRKIPGTSETIPAIGIGTWETFDVADNVSAEIDQLKTVLKILVEKGGAVIDTSPMYGFAERNVGHLSTELGLNDRLFIATKVWTQGKENGEEQIRNSMQLLKRDQLDLLQIHNLVDWQTHLKTLRKLKEEGKIRYIGITHYRESAYDDLAKIIHSEPIDFLQVNYNIEDRQASDKLLPLAQDKNLGVLISQPFGYGKLFQKVKNKELPSLAKDLGCKTWAQYFLKYVISHPAVTCAIPGTGNPEHMLDNIGAAFGVLPDEGQRKKMVTFI